MANPAMQNQAANLEVNTMTSQDPKEGRSLLTYLGSYSCIVSHLIRANDVRASQASIIQLAGESLRPSLGACQPVISDPSPLRLFGPLGLGRRCFRTPGCRQLLERQLPKTYQTIVSPQS